jgi:hypothetical protein
MDFVSPTDSHSGTLKMNRISS